ncbi:TonB-dependent receptor plug domain-containing protein [Aliikangiella sp. IMCC44632]
MQFARKNSLAAAIILASFMSSSPSYAQSSAPLGEFNLAQLLKIKIKTAARIENSLLETPATAVVITQEEILKRGYRELSEVFYDLPSVDMINPRGDTWFTSYLRGVNQTGGTTLLMLDGDVLNHLFFDSIQVMSTLSLANIERIELIFGPTAVAYGDNAFLGAINVITRSGKKGADGFRGTATLGSNNRQLVDLSHQYSVDDWVFNAAVRLDKGNLDTTFSERYEYTKSRYLQDERLWGDFVNGSGIAGNNNSAHDNRFIDLKVGFKNTQLRLQSFEVDSGYGNVYATDKAQKDAHWIRPEQSIALKHYFVINNDLSTTSQLRYRRTDIDNDSFFLEGFEFAGVPGGRLIDVSNWRSINRSLGYTQDFEYNSERWTASFGVKFERKDLQKAYDVTRGENPFVAPSDLINWQSYDMPVPPQTSSIPNNRRKTNESSAYLLVQKQTKAVFGLGESATLNLGGRFENHSYFGSRPLFNAGYVVNDAPYAYKLTWGQAFQEPSARLLFGGWNGIGSDPNLNPEKSQTIEASWNYLSESARATFAFTNVVTEQTISAFAGGAGNEQGKRVTQSIDMIFSKSLQLEQQQLMVWANYSHVFDVKPIMRANDIEQSFQQNSNKGPTGDIAKHKLKVGVDWKLQDDINLNYRARFISKRYTSALNPIEEIPAYQVSDINLLWQNAIDNIDLNFAITNLFNQPYFHPGINNADAGEDPGEFDINNNWMGSKGFFSSKLAQPGREFSIGFSTQF